MGDAAALNNARLRELAALSEIKMLTDKTLSEDGRKVLAEVKAAAERQQTDRSHG